MSDQEETHSVTSFKRIQEFTDDELINELSNRFNHFIMGARKDTTFNNNPKVIRTRFWVGDYDVCIGLMFGASIDCLHKNWGVKEDDICLDE